MEKILFSQPGYKKYQGIVLDLEKKLKELQSQVGEMIDVGGDCWHDNSGYEDLQIQIRGADKRYVEHCKNLNSAHIVGYPQNPNKVGIGTKVTYLINDEEITYKIVGFGEGAPEKSIITYQAPLVIKSTGKEEGDVFDFDKGGNIVEIEIYKIEAI